MSRLNEFALRVFVYVAILAVPLVVGVLLGQLAGMLLHGDAVAASSYGTNAGSSPP